MKNLNRTYHRLDISVDLGHGARGMLVVDSTCLQTSAGGVRIAEDIDQEEVRSLASEMSSKFAFSGLPRGGAKAGVMIPEELEAEKRTACLESFGRSIMPLIQKGVYYPGMDMNCGAAELRSIYRGAGMTIGNPTDTSLFTAMSASEALWAFREVAAFPNDRPVKLLIEGFGNVGTHLARRLPEEAFSIVGVSTIRGAAYRKEGFSGKELTEAREHYGDDCVSHLPAEKMSLSALFEQSADVLVPSARVRSLTSDLAAILNVDCIVPVANAPYMPGVPEYLEQEGVMCLPGYVVNNGGVFASGFYDMGIPVPLIDLICVEHYRPVLTALLSKAKERNCSPIEIAEKIVRKRFRPVSGSSESRWMRISKRLVREKILPKSFYGRRRWRQYEAYLAGLKAEIENEEFEDGSCCPFGSGE